MFKRMVRMLKPVMLFALVCGLLVPVYPAVSVYANDVVIIDNGNSGYAETGTWRDSGLRGYNNSGTRYANTVNTTATWTPVLAAGTYDVYVYKIYHATSSSVQAYEIMTDSGLETATSDFTTGSSGWELLGEYEFGGSGTEYVKLVNPGGAYIRADAVKFEKHLEEGIISVKVNGELQTYVESAFLQQDSAFAPAVQLLEALDADADWNALTGVLTAEKGAIVLELEADSGTAVLNGLPFALEEPAVVVNGTLMAPVRDMAASFGAETVWSEATQTIDVYVVRYDGALTEIPYPPDLSNRAGWWSPIVVQDTVYGQEVYMGYSAQGLTEGFHTIKVAHRDEAGIWSQLHTYEDEFGTVAEYVNDAGHRQSSVAIDGSGRLHLFGSMHTSSWNYYRNDGSGTDLLRRSTEMPDSHTTFTYPVASTAPNGDVYVIARVDEYLHASPPKREGKLYRWDNANETWSVVGAFAGEADRAVYPDDIQIDDNGDVHILYEWSPFPSAGARHHLSYIKYVPATGLWEDHAGSPLTVPVNVSASDAIEPFAGGDEEWTDTEYTGPAVQSAKMTLHGDTISVAYRHRDTLGGSFKIKTAFSSSGSSWQKEDVYTSTSTSATVAIAHSDGQTRIYYARSGHAYMAYKTANGSYAYEQLTSGKSISHLAAVHMDGADYMYLFGYRAPTSPQGAYARLFFRTVEPPVKPDIVGLAAGDGEAELEWNPVDGATGYAVWYGTAPGVYDLGPVTVGALADSAVIDGLTNGTPYYFVVRALKGGLQSANSMEATATPQED